MFFGLFFGAFARPAGAATALLAVLFAVTGVRTASACDVCAVYTVEELGEIRPGPRIGVAEQFTHFGTTLENSEEVPNPNGEFLDSSFTQFALGWRFTDWLDAQVVIPLLHRSWRRNFAGAIQEKSRTGIGDIATLARVRALSLQNERGLLRFSGYGGLTFPSGDSSFLAEELQAEVADSLPPWERPAHAGSKHGASHEDASAIHGHDLTFGTGSVNGIIGAEFFGTWDRFLATANLQYTLYTEGSYDYRFANELIFRGGVGYYLWLSNEGSFAIQGIVSGDTKGQDQQRGETLGDTAATYVFAGPRLLGRWGSSLGIDAGVQIPFIRHETSLQIAPDWRVRAALSWKF